MSRRARRHKHGRRPLAAYSAALTLAEGDADAPQPLCKNRSKYWVDYEREDCPDEETAAAMCAPCPLLELCAANARQQKPVHGVWGGIAWVDRRMAHLNPDPKHFVEKISS